MSDTTDLMGAADTNVDTSAPAAGAAPKRRRSGTGLEGMVLAELQQVASGLGIRGTARMRKSQLIEVIKETQAGGGSAPKAASTADTAEAKPKRRATSKARTGEAAEQAPASKPAAQAQIEIPGQPASDDAPAGERRRRRATAPSGSPESSAPAAVQVEQKTETVPAAAAPAETKAEAATAVSAPQGPIG
ncbi:Rho termination factor N-terminal domain-containing protein, partial [Streptomyces goshikiensis]|uniref:Rho termination factor N-terminal domain-containing protein n=1 Tax=Streptomyces goshikiensis TaxID=1942 RepID=UPI00332EF9EF